MQTKHHHFLVCLLISLAPACTSLRDASPGINRRETKVLETSYYWKREWGAGKRHTEQSLSQLMQKSLDPTLDGERSEGYGSTLMLALADAGDEVFTKAMAGQSLEIRKSVARYIRHLVDDGLSYPLTEAACGRDDRPGRP